MSAYMIWSNQHHQWWRPNERGYTDVIEEAGRYDLERAVGIVARATLGGALTYRRTDPVTGRTYEMVDEVMVPAPEIRRDAASRVAAEYSGGVVTAYMVLDLGHHLELRLRSDQTDPTATGRLVAVVALDEGDWLLHQRGSARLDVDEQRWAAKADAREALVALGERHVAGAS
jgi:hypothetical protein